jgi:hypothetical protein
LTHKRGAESGKAKEGEEARSEKGTKGARKNMKGGGEFRSYLRK